MQEYDVALKLLLQQSARLTMLELTGTVIEKWLDVELPQVQNLRLDLLDQTAGGDLVHLELQSRNDPAMPLRMAEYCLGIYRLWGRFPTRCCSMWGRLRCAWSMSFAAATCGSSTGWWIFARWTANGCWRARK